MNMNIERGIHSSILSTFRPFLLHILVFYPSALWFGCGIMWNTECTLYVRSVFCIERYEMNASLFPGMCRKLMEKTQLTDSSLSTENAESYFISLEMSNYRPLNCFKWFFCVHSMLHCYNTVRILRYAYEMVMMASYQKQSNDSFLVSQILYLRSIWFIAYIFIEMLGL